MGAPGSNKAEAMTAQRVAVWATAAVRGGAGRTPTSTSQTPSACGAGLIDALNGRAGRFISFAPPKETNQRKGGPRLRPSGVPCVGREPKVSLHSSALRNGGKSRWKRSSGGNGVLKLRATNPDGIRMQAGFPGNCVVSQTLSNERHS